MEVAMRWNEITRNWQHLGSSVRERCSKLAEDGWKIIREKSSQLVSRTQGRHGVKKDAE